MLMLSQLVGFGSGGGGVDVTPDAIDFGNISNAGLTAAAYTNVVTITGIDAVVTLRLTLTAVMSDLRNVLVYRNGVFVTYGNSGTSLDVTIMNGQTLQYAFANYQDLTTWTGTATLTNESDGGVVLDTFTFTLQDTGSSPPVGVGGGGVGVGAIP